MSKDIESTTRGLAKAMFEELNLLRSGDSTPQMASAKSKIANSAIALARLEMEYARFVPSTRTEDKAITAGLKPIKMG